MKLVVGLGNPGSRYVGTRHNVGFEVVNRLVSRHGTSLRKTQFEATMAEVHLGGARVLLAAPQTFMNLSGQSVRKVVDFYKLATDEILVVCDDMNLELGRLRMKPDGSSGGQKGLQNIMDHLGTIEVARLRVGIGRPQGRKDSTSHVLGRYSAKESEEMDLAVERAADAVHSWATEGMPAAMNRFNVSTSETPKKARTSGASGSGAASGKEPV